MADQLATVADLASALQQDVDTSTATLLVECATAVVQEACGGQRIVQVVDDQLAIMGDTNWWLALPQIPVTAVTAVVLDGTTLTTAANDYKVFGNRLWRKQGWQTNYGWPLDWPWSTWGPWVGVNGAPFNWWDLQSGEPSAVAITYTHGYPSGHQMLQLARGFVLSLASGAYANPSAAKSESIDDYSITYGQMASALEASPYMKAALRRQYGRRTGLVRLG